MGLRGRSLLFWSSRRRPIRHLAMRSGWAQDTTMIGLTNKQIKDKIFSTILHTAPEELHNLPGKLSGYMDILSDRIMRCCDEKGEVVRCDSCMEAGILLRTTRAAIDKYSK